MNVTTKTKILAWGVAGEKEKLDLDLCDFSADQVGELDRLIRADGDDKVKITLTPEQKKLQIEPITSTVKLVSMSCRTKGQKLRVSGFHSPDERAPAIKRMSAADTPILLTISEIQPAMFGRTKSAIENTGNIERAANWEKPDGTAETQIPHSELIEVKCKGLKLASAKIDLVYEGPGQWRSGYTARLGNYTQDRDAQEGPAFASRTAALNAAQLGIGAWLDEIPMTGTADGKRALSARRAKMREQVIAATDARIREDDSKEGTDG
ncbi:MAG: hypothetical protein ABFE01_13665, partial [Phycisphaerales bacterium]